jgi:hypothetical protein
MRLDDIVLPIGKPLTLAVKGQDYKQHVFDATLIGYEVGQMVMLSMPVKPGQVLLHSGLQVEVKISLPEGQAIFKTSIDEVGDWGFRYVKLDYPGQIDYQNPRQHIRVPTDYPVELVGHTSLGIDTDSIHGHVLDVSVAGIRVVTEKEFTSMVSSVTVGMFLSAYGMERDMTLDAKIFNSAPLSEDYPDYGFGYGLEFINLDDTNKWFLHAYILEHVKRQRVILFS